jgi:hypothetical protein
MNYMRQMAAPFEFLLEKMALIEAGHVNPNNLGDFSANRSKSLISSTCEQNIPGSAQSNVTAPKIHPFTRISKTECRRMAMFYVQFCDHQN